MPMFYSCNVSVYKYPYDKLCHKIYELQTNVYPMNNSIFNSGLVGIEDNKLYLSCQTLKKTDLSNSLNLSSSCSENSQTCFWICPDYLSTADWTTYYLNKTQNIFEPRCCNEHKRNQ